MPPRKTPTRMQGKGFKSLMNKTKKFLKKSHITSKAVKFIAPMAGKYSDEVRELGDVARQLGMGGQGMIIIPPKRRIVRKAIRKTGVKLPKAYNPNKPKRGGRK